MLANLDLVYIRCTFTTKLAQSGYFCKCHCSIVVWHLYSRQEAWGSNPACTRLWPIFKTKKEGGYDLSLSQRSSTKSLACHPETNYLISGMWHYALGYCTPRMQRISKKWNISKWLQHENRKRKGGGGGKRGTRKRR